MVISFTSILVIHVFFFIFDSSKLVYYSIDLFKNLDLDSLIFHHCLYFIFNWDFYSKFIKI